MSDSLRPHGMPHQTSLSFTISQSLLKFMSMESVSYLTISPSAAFFSFCLQSFPASGSFQMTQFFTSGGLGIGASASASVLPMNIQDWFPLELTGLSSLQSKGFSRVFSNTTILKHRFFGAPPSLWSNSHIHTQPLEKPQHQLYGPGSNILSICLISGGVAQLLSEEIVRFYVAISSVWKFQPFHVFSTIFLQPLDFKEIQPVHPKRNQSWVFIGRTDVEAETPIFWPPDAKSWLIWKDPDAGKDWGQEKGTTEDEMVGWHHWLNGHEFG